MSPNQSFSIILSGISSIINGLVILSEKIKFDIKKLWQKILIPTKFSMIAIPTIFLLTNTFLFLPDFLLSKYTNITYSQTFDMKSLILTSVVGVTTSYIFFGMESLEKNTKIGIWMLMISTKVYLVFYLIVTYLICFELNALCELTQFLFPIIILTLILSGIIKTLKIKLFPKYKNSFKRFYRAMLYRESLEKQSQYRTFVNTILTITKEHSEYNLYLYGEKNKERNRVDIGKNSEDTFVHMNDKKFLDFLNYIDTILQRGGATIQKNKNTLSPTPNPEKTTLKNLKKVNVTLNVLKKDGKKDGILVLSSPQDINFENLLTTTNKRFLERIVKNIFTFTRVDESEISLIDVQELFQDYITAINQKNHIRVEELNSDIRVYYDTFRQFLKDKGIRYSTEDATAEFGIFMKGLSWKELEECFRHMRYIFYENIKNKKDSLALFHAVRRLPGGILYKSVSQRDLLGVKGISDWYFKELSKVELDYALLNLDELINVYLKYEPSEYKIIWDITEILFYQYLTLLKRFLGKQSNFDLILERFKNVFEDYHREVELESLIRRGLVQNYQEEYDFLTRKKRLGHELIWGLSSYWRKESSKEKSLFCNKLENALPNDFEQLLILYIDIRKGNWVWDWWDILPNGEMQEIKNNYQVVLFKKLFAMNNITQNLGFENFHSYIDKHKSSFFNEIYLIKNLIENLNNHYSADDFGIESSEVFESKKEIIKESFQRIIDSLENLETDRIFNYDISTRTKNLFFDRFKVSIRNEYTRKNSLHSILKKHFHFNEETEDGEIVKKEESLQMLKILNKTNFIDESPESIKELADNFAEGMMEGETNLLLNTLLEQASVLEISEFKTFIENNKDISLFISRITQYKMQDIFNKEFTYDSTSKKYTNLVYLREDGSSIPVYELNINEDILLIISNKTKGSIIRKQENKQTLITNLRDIGKDQDLLNEILNENPNWLSSYTNQDEKIAYLKTLVFLEIYENLSLENISSEILLKVNINE